MFIQIKKKITAITIICMILSSFSATNVFATDISTYGGPKSHIYFDTNHYIFDVVNGTGTNIPGLFSWEYDGYPCEAIISYRDEMDNIVTLNNSSYKFIYEYDYKWFCNLFISPEAFNTTGMTNGDIIVIDVVFQYNYPGWYISPQYETFELELSKPSGEKPILNPPKYTTLPFEYLVENGLEIPVTWGTGCYKKAGNGVDSVGFYYDNTQDEGEYDFIIPSGFIGADDNFVIINKEFFAMLKTEVIPKVGHKLFLTINFSTIDGVLADETPFTVTIGIPTLLGSQPIIIDPKSSSLPMEELIENGLKIPVAWGTDDYAKKPSNDGVDSVRIYYDNAQDEGDYDFIIPSIYISADNNFVTINKDFFAAFIQEVMPKVGHEVFFTVNFDTLKGGIVKDEFTLTIDVNSVKPEILVDEIVYPRNGDVTLPVRWGTRRYAKANNSNDGVKSITITHNMVWGPMVNTLKRDVEYKIVGDEIIILEKTFNTLTLNNPLLFTVTFDVINGSAITDTFNFRAQ